jgi:hypothetical protein
LQTARRREPFCFEQTSARPEGANLFGLPKLPLLPLPIIENSGSDGSLGDVLAKNKFRTAMLGLLSPKTTLNISDGDSRLLGDQKNFVFPLFNTTDAASYCKNDLASSQDTLST